MEEDVDNPPRQFRTAMPCRLEPRVRRDGAEPGGRAGLWGARSTSSPGQSVATALLSGVRAGEGV